MLFRSLLQRLTYKLAFVAAAMSLLVSAAFAQTGPMTPQTALTSVSELYSQIDLAVKLVFAPMRRGYGNDPVTQECAGPTLFEKRVVRLGERLAEAAYTLHPDLKQRIPKFEFSVSERLEPGVASTARGLIVVLAPVNDFVVSDEALAFTIAREMGHVISRHHEQNTITSIAFSLVATILAPALNLGRLLAAASTSASNTTLANAVSSGTSYVSSRAMIASYGSRQRKNADAVALRLMPQAGFDTQAVATGLTPVCTDTEPNRWLRQLNESIAAIPAAPPPPAALTAAAPEADTGDATPDRKSTRLNSSHVSESRMPSSA